MHEHELASSNFLLISLSWCVLCCVSFSVVYRKLQMSCLTYFISMHEYRLISWTNFLNRWTATWVVQLQIKQTYGNWKIYYRVKKVKMEPIYLIVNSFWRINKMKESIIPRHNSIVLTWDIRFSLVGRFHLICLLSFSTQ